MAKLLHVIRLFRVAPGRRQPSAFLDSIFSPFPFLFSVTSHHSVASSQKQAPEPAFVERVRVSGQCCLRKLIIPEGEDHLCWKEHCDSGQNALRLNYSLPPLSLSCFVSYQLVLTQYIYLPVLNFI